MLYKLIVRVEKVLWAHFYRPKITEFPFLKITRISFPYQRIMEISKLDYTRYYTRNRCRARFVEKSEKCIVFAGQKFLPITEMTDN